MADRAVRSKERAALLAVARFGKRRDVLFEHGRTVRIGGAAEQLGSPHADRFISVPKEQLPATDVEGRSQFAVFVNRIQECSRELRARQQCIDNGAPDRRPVPGPTHQEALRALGVLMPQE